MKIYSLQDNALLLKCQNLMFCEHVLLFCSSHYIKWHQTNKVPCGVLTHSTILELPMGQLMQILRGRHPLVWRQAICHTLTCLYSNQTTVPSSTKSQWKPHPTPAVLCVSPASQRRQSEKNNSLFIHS